MSDAVEIRRDDDSSIDEIVASGANLHVERMSGNCFFVGLEASDGSYWQFWIGARNGKSPVDVRHYETTPARIPVERDQLTSNINHQDGK